jgi:hypothetical protein
LWKCDTCIHKNKLGIKMEICERHCKDCFNRIGKYNLDYQEIVEKPTCCGKCSYCIKSPFDDSYICHVKCYKWKDDANFTIPIRKNYLTKNTPKWCKL